MARITTRQPGTSWPQYRFKDGQLYIFKEHGVVLIRGTPEARALRKNNDSDWQSYDPELRLIRPYRSRRVKPSSSTQLLLFDSTEVGSTESNGRRVSPKRRALDAFRFSLPKAWGRLLERLPSHQFPLIRWCHVPEFLELLEAHTPLAFGLAHREALSGEFVGELRGGSRGRARDTVRRLRRAELASKQKELLETLGFPATPSAVKSVGRLVPESLTIHHLRGMRSILRDPTRAATLRHLSTINGGVIELVADEQLQRAAAPTLLQQVAADAREKYLPRTAETLRATLFLLGQIREHSKNPRFRDQERLQQVHDELLDRYQRDFEANLELRFPRPPIPGIAAIEPLRSPLDLIREGEQQKNCVASYAVRVSRGDVYCYRVSNPERATLSIAPARGGGWRVSELRTSCNRTCSTTTREFVEEWLQDAAL